MTDDQTTACPACDSTRITRRSASIQDKDRKSDLPWYCSDCRNDFAEPVERARHGPKTEYRSGLAQDLAKADSWADLEARRDNV